MENRVYNEKKGLWYEKRGDYYLPCLELSEEEAQPIGGMGTTTQPLPKAKS